MSNKNINDILSIEDDVNQSTSKKSSQFNFINYKNERNAFWLEFYPTSRTLYKIFEVINTSMSQEGKSGNRDLKLSRIVLRILLRITANLTAFFVI